MLLSIDYFRVLDDDIIEELHYKLSVEYFEPDTVVFAAGDECKALYFVSDGELDLLISAPSSDEEVLLDTLYTGCTIGAYSLIK